MEETQIILKDDTEFAKVVKLSNGIEVGEIKITIDNLLYSVFELVEEEQFAELFLNHEEAIEHGLGPFISEQKPEAVNRILELFLSRARYKAEPEIVKSFFNTITSYFQIDEMAPEKIHEFLSMFLKKAREVDDAKLYKDILYTLLDKIQLTKAKDDIVQKVLQLVLKRAGTESDVRVIENLFYTLASKARPKWVRQTLASYVKNGEEKVVKSPILPKNCILYQEELDGTEVFVIEVEKQLFDVTYHTTHFENVGHPKLLFEFKIRNDKVVTCRIFAVKDPIIKPTSKLYYYPFSNVFSTFQACWPDLQNIVISGVHQLTSLPFLFINSPSNDHLYRGKNLRELFASLQDKDFDEEILESTSLTISSHFGIE